MAGSAPALLIAIVAAATERIRLGSGGVQSGHRTALSVVEEFGILDALHPGRLDLGLGRSGGRKYFDRLAAAGARQEAAAANGDRAAEAPVRDAPIVVPRLRRRGTVPPSRRRGRWTTGW